MQRTCKTARVASGGRQRAVGTPAMGRTLCKQPGGCTQAASICRLCKTARNRVSFARLIHCNELAVSNQHLAARQAPPLAAADAAAGTGVAGRGRQARGGSSAAPGMPGTGMGPAPACLPWRTRSTAPLVQAWPSHFAPSSAQQSSPDHGISHNRVTAVLEAQQAQRGLQGGRGRAQAAGGSSRKRGGRGARGPCAPCSQAPGADTVSRVWAAGAQNVALARHQVCRSCGCCECRPNPARLHIQIVASHHGSNLLSVQLLRHRGQRGRCRVFFPRALEELPCCQQAGGRARSASREGNSPTALAMRRGQYGMYPQPHPRAQLPCSHAQLSTPHQRAPALGRGLVHLVSQQLQPQRGMGSRHSIPSRRASARRRGTCRTSVSATLPRPRGPVRPAWAPQVQAADSGGVQFEAGHWRRHWQPS